MVSNGKLGLHELVEDVLILILVDCDIVDVIAVSETSKYFHDLAFSRTIWYSLVTKLVHRGFIQEGKADDPCLAHLSTDQLVGRVKRILRGPETWTNTRSEHEYESPAPAGPAVRRAATLFRKLTRKPLADLQPLVEARRIVLRPGMAPNPGVPPGAWTLHWQSKAQLFPGGKYVLFNSRGRLQCWNVPEDRLIWTHIPSIDHASVIDFEVDMVKCGLAVVLACQRTWVAPHRSFVEIHTLNLATGVSDLELVSRVPECGHDFAHIDYVLCGDIVAVHLRLSSHLLLINWRKRCRITIASHISQMALAPGYLVVVLKGTAFGEYKLAVSRLASFTSWEPNDSLEEPSTRISITDLPLLPHTITLMGSPYYTKRRWIWLFESPLEQRRYKIWVHMWVDGGPALCSYHLATQDIRVPWRFLSLISMPAQMTPIGMSLSGHTLGFRAAANTPEIFPPVPASDHGQRVPEVIGQGPLVQMSSFSGALTSWDRKEVVVAYYE
ncbi:hypothetical protein K438DRAFT_2149310 [Mycena galopus ATCC 62051]|nr:hypothetical protein K438DRAFT_2149310 [Mycena galopus ATCC 62051]